MSYKRGTGHPFHYRPKASTWAGLSSGSSPLWFSCRQGYPTGIHVPNIPIRDSCSKKQKKQKLGKPINLYVALCMVWPLYNHPVSISLLDTNVFMLRRMENLDYLFLPGFLLQPFKSVALAKITYADNQLVSTFFPSQLWWGTSLTVERRQDGFFSTIHACTDAGFYSTQHFKTSPLFLRLPCLRVKKNA